MWPYWLMFLVPAAAAMLQPAGATFKRRQHRGATGELLWALVALTLTMVIGFRTEVGADWFSYLDNYEGVRGTAFADAISAQDPGFQLLMWVCAELGADVHAVNFVCAAIFSLGLVTFCRTLPHPWLALAVAMPYMVIVVAMGYTRQAVALGTGMLAIAALQRKSMVRFIAWSLLGATFHRTAVLLLPIAALVESRNRTWTIFWIGVVTFGAYGLLLSESVDSLYANYVEAQYESQGALVRLLMNAVPAIILLLFRKRFRFPGDQARLWQWFAIISLILLAVLFATGASTAVDRVGLYMLPLQLAVFSHLPSVIHSTGRRAFPWVSLIVLYYAAVLFIWLNFAAHSSSWLPYRFYLLEG